MALDTVTVACKLPAGVVLNLDRYELEGPNKAVRRVEGKDTVTLKGWSRRADQPIHTIGGYGMTEVDASFWTKWRTLNADSPLVRDNLLFALPKAEDAAAKAREQAEVPAMFAPGKLNVEGVKTADKE